MSMDSEHFQDIDSWICHMTDHIPAQLLQIIGAYGSGIDQFLTLRISVPLELNGWLFT